MSYNYDPTRVADFIDPWWGLGISHWCLGRFSRISGSRWIHIDGNNRNSADNVAESIYFEAAVTDDDWKTDVIRRLERIESLFAKIIALLERVAGKSYDNN